MTDQAESGYYQAIAREFFRRRGAPFFLSPRDLAVIAGWEKQNIPLEVVLEGIGRAFDGIRDPARGKKGFSLSFCETHVQKALAQHTDRAAGRRRAPSPRSDKAGRALGEAGRCLRSLPADDKELRALFETGSGLLSRPSPDEEALEKIDQAVDELLWRRASRSDRDGQKRHPTREWPERDPAEIEAAVRTRVVKSSRLRQKIPYVSLFYY